MSHITRYRAMLNACRAAYLDSNPVLACLAAASSPTEERHNHVFRGHISILCMLLCLSISFLLYIFLWCMTPISGQLANYFPLFWVKRLLSSLSPPWEPATLFHTQCSPNKAASHWSKQGGSQAETQNSPGVTVATGRVTEGFMFI